jgi:hypothetical protein
MTVAELIEALRDEPAQAEVILPGGHYGNFVVAVGDVVRVPDVVLSDASHYPVVMLQNED